MAPHYKLSPSSSPTYVSGLLAGRPTAATPGLFYYAYDVDTLYLFDGQPDRIGYQVGGGGDGWVAVAGASGSSGTTILSGAGGPPGASGSIGDWWVDTASGYLWGPKTNTGWPASAIAMAKDPGLVLSGARAPLAGDGQNGDWWLDTSTATLYGPKGGGVWPSVGSSLSGSVNGRVLYGNGNPNNANGLDGDFYIDVLANPRRLYGPKVTTWPSTYVTLSSSNGGTVLSGIGAPSALIGSDGDFYLDSSAKALYGPKTAGAWPSSGYPMVQAQTLSGAGAPGALIGEEGDWYIDTASSTRDLYGPKGFAGWPVTPIPLVQTSVSGIVLSGNGGPSPVNGSDGDFWLDLLTNRLYGPKTAGIWPGTFIPLDGVDEVVEGTTVPGGTPGTHESLYVNLTSSRVYVPNATRTNWVDVTFSPAGLISSFTAQPAGTDPGAATFLADDSKSYLPVDIVKAGLDDFTDVAGGYVPTGTERVVLDDGRTVLATDLGTSDEVAEAVVAPVGAPGSGTTIHVDRATGKVYIPDPTRAAWVDFAPTYVHAQTAASNSWTINHNLGFLPDVYVTNALGHEVDVEVQHVTTSQCVVLANAPFSGVARCT